ncbi:MAG: YggT family protein [Nocardiopsaceae bacterium]|nr:YggT family protein [Nocardiopsaceae bacterium]
MIISWIRAFAPSWHPTGVILVVVETVLTITDPPLKFLRRYIKPLRIGTVALDLSFMVLFIVVLILLSVTGAPIG